MKKAHVWLGLCLLLALAAMSQQTTAQVAPANTLMAGEGIQEPGDKFAAAIAAGDHAAVYNLLAPWKQNAVKLSLERLKKRIDAKEFTAEAAEKWLARRDARGKLGIKTLDQLKAAKPEQYLALQTGLAQLPEKQAGWLMTDRIVGLHEPTDRRMRVLPWGGWAQYENADGGSIALSLAIEKDKWTIVDYTITIGKQTCELGRSLAQDTGGPRAWTPMEEARGAEGEQLLGSARDYCRVQYAKTGSVDAVTKPFNKEVANGSFDGEYYEVTEYFKELPGSKFDAAIIAKPSNKNDAWLIITFMWASGNSEIEWLESEEALNARIRELTKAEVPERPEQLPVPEEK